MVNLISAFEGASRNSPSQNNTGNCRREPPLNKLTIEETLNKLLRHEPKQHSQKEMSGVWQLAWNFLLASMIWEAINKSGKVPWNSLLASPCFYQKFVLAALYWAEAWPKGDNGGPNWNVDSGPPFLGSSEDWTLFRDLCGNLPFWGLFTVVI